MSAVIAWLGFLGGWLLFAGPLYQASLELDEEQLERDRIAERQATIAKPPPVSPWWWLVPVLGYYLEMRRTRGYRRAVMAALDASDRADLVRYLRKARGWALVALGGLLLATNETWEVCEHYEWPVWVFAVLAAALAGLSAAYTANNQRQSHQYVELDGR